MNNTKTKNNRFVRKGSKTSEINIFLWSVDKDSTITKATDSLIVQFSS